MTKGVVSGGVDLRLRRIMIVEPVTNTSSSSCANNGDGRRREYSARRRPSRLYFSHFATSTVYNTVDLYAVYAAIFVQNRVFCLPHLHSTHPLGGFPSEHRHPVWRGKTRTAWLPDGEKISKISLFVLTQLTNMKCEILRRITFHYRFKPCRFGDGLRRTRSRNMASFVVSQTNCTRR